MVFYRIIPLFGNKTIFTLEDSNNEIERLSSVCSNCKSSISENEKFCSECGFPENGSDEDRGKFRSRVGAKKRLLKVVQKEVKRAKSTLVVLGVLSALVGVLYGFVIEAGDVATLVIYSIIAVIYFGLAIWSDKQPFAAILTALILYGTLIIVSAIFDPATIVSGIVLKIIIISFLIKGLKSGNEAKKVMKELEELGIKDV